MADAISLGSRLSRCGGAYLITLKQRTTMTMKDEMMGILVKLQSMQRIAMGIVTIELASRIYDDETCNIDAMVSVPASRGIEDRFKFFNFYSHNDAEDNKKVMSALIQQLKEWGAI